MLAYFHKQCHVTQYCIPNMCKERSVKRNINRRLNFHRNLHKYMIAWFFIPVHKYRLVSVFVFSTGTTLAASVQLIIPLVY